MIRVAVIDDEPLARSGVIARLAKHSDLRIVGEYSDGIAAIEGVLRTSPDLLLLDIQMPALDGLSMLQKMPAEQRPMVIFLTAYDNFAVRAFDLRAIDYVLKPIEDERFDSALQRAREFYATRNRESQPHVISVRPDSTQAYRSRFSVRTGRRVKIIQAGDVEWIEADGDYAALHTADGIFLLRESLAVLSEQLDPTKYVRVHRSTIVRLDQVVEFQSLTNRDAILRLRDGTPIRVSRTYIENLVEKLDRWRASR